jgi:hypothetical protein
MSGWDRLAPGSIPLLRIAPTGIERILVPVEPQRPQQPAAARESIYGIPVSWNGGLWLWHRPARMLRIDPASGGILEVREPEFGNGPGPVHVLRGVYMIDSRFARSFSWTDTPVLHYTGVRIYEYRIDGWPTRDAPDGLTSRLSPAR